MYEILPFVVSFVVTYLSLMALIRVTELSPIFSNTQLKRSDEVINPRMGGIGIFLGLALTFSLVIYEMNNIAVVCFAIAILLQVIIGIKKEMRGISAASFFWGQFIIASILIVFGGFKITNLNGFLGIGVLSELQSILLSYIVIISISTIFNFAKGMDEIATMVSLLSMSFFSIFFFINGEQVFAMFSLTMAGCLSAYLIYKYRHTNEFLGYPGLLLIGIINAGIVLKFISVVPAALFPVQSALVIVVAILLIPILNSVRIVLNRIFRGKNNFISDGKQLHHLLLDKGFSQKQSIVCYFVVGLFFILLALILDRFLNPTYVLLIVFSVAFTILGWLQSTKRNNLVIVSKQKDIKVESEKITVEEKRRD